MAGELRLCVKEPRLCPAGENRKGHERVMLMRECAEVMNDDENVTN